MKRIVVFLLLFALVLAGCTQTAVAPEGSSAVAELTVTDGEKPLRMVLPGEAGKLNVRQLTRIEVVP